MSGPSDMFPANLPQGDAIKAGFDFELHYDLHSKRSQGIFDEILNDSSPSKHIHNWDKKILPSPVHALARVGAKKYLVENAHRALVTYSKVEQVLPPSWSYGGSTDTQETDSIDSYLFFTKVRAIMMNILLTTLIVP